MSQIRIRKREENIWLAGSLAVSYFTLDDYEKAQHYLDITLKLDSNFDRAHFLFGMIKTAQNMFSEAEASLNKALLLNPQNPFYHCIYGMAQAAQQRYPEAIEAFNRTLSLAPSYGLGYYQLGRALTQQKQFPEARLALERAVDLRPDLAEAHYRLGTVYVRLGEKEKAEKAMANFQKFQAKAMDERQEMLKSMREIVLPDSSVKNPG